MRLPLACVIFLVLSLSAQSPKLTATPEDLVTFDCAREQVLHSPSIPSKASFVLNNKSQEPIKIFWISRDGQRIPYNNNQPLAAGRSYSQVTYQGDIWVVTDSQEKCLSIFAAEPSNTAIDFFVTDKISRSMAGSAPSSLSHPVPDRSAYAEALAAASRAQDMWESLSNSTPEQQRQGDAAQQQMKQWEAAGYPLSLSPLLAGRDPAKLTPEQRQQLEKANEMMAASVKAQAAMNSANANAASSTRPQDQMMNSMLAYIDAFAATRGTSNMPDQLAPDQGNFSGMDCEKLAKESGSKEDPQAAQKRLDRISSLWNAILPIYQLNGVEENLRGLSSMGFYFISLVQTCNWRDEPANPSSRPNPSGYAMMSHLKGTFAESISPRKITSLPGNGENYNQALKAAGDSADLLSTIVTQFLPLLPPEKQKEFSALPPTERIRALNDYYEQLKKDNPAQAEHLQEQVTQASQTSLASVRADYIRNMEQIKIRVNDQLSDSQATPLAFLSLLRPHEVFVDLYGYKVLFGAQRGSEQYLAIISDSQGPLRKLRLGSAATIDSAVKSLTRAVKGGDDLAPTWKNLQQQIVRPILDALPPGTEKVWLSPDGMLAYVPFASLLIDMDTSVRIGIIPSPYDFVRVRENKEPPPGQVLFVGALDYGNGRKYPYLQQAHDEIEALSRHAAAVGLHPTSLTGSQITRPVVIGHLEGIRFLHFSTHGFLKNESAGAEGKPVLPGGIALSLANSGAPDSFLNAEDIYKINLSGVDLVTLSACETGEGTPIEGQGLLGFQTAFMAAGTRSLLFSLWRAPANEATTMLMERFYDGVWKNHLPKAEALRQAQMWVRSDPRFADPRNWATWVMVGEAW